ncbi:MAG: 3-dehydroquinate synthase [Thermodesulfovibrionales bacterium]|nr:3-dehydroquinate synthase [Thermodesulfovibrionales bacterium]
MNAVRVSLGERSYDILIGKGIIEKLVDFIHSKKYTFTAIITNDTLAGIYKDLIERLRGELNAISIIIPDGEEYKDLLWFYYLHTKLLEKRFDRSSCLIAFGGGVVGDLTGFVASTYMRGIDYIQLPTTLLAQVDSSVGGKTAVNHPLGKNMIGTFYQPVLVIIDTDFLKTLPKREFRAGMAEVIKYGIIWDEGLFTFLNERNREISDLEPESLKKIIARSCEIKAEIVSRDEREEGLRAVLNFGHTIGHAIETVTGYTRFLHGEAIAMGMYGESFLASKKGLTDDSTVKKIKDILMLYGLKPSIPDDINGNSIFNAMLIDKKAKAGKIRMVLPEKIGRVIISEVDKEELLRVLENARV